MHRDVQALLERCKNMETPQRPRCVLASQLAVATLLLTTTHLRKNENKYLHMCYMTGWQFSPPKRHTVTNVTFTATRGSKENKIRCSLPLYDP